MKIATLRFFFKYLISSESYDNFIIIFTIKISTSW